MKLYVRIVSEAFWRETDKSYNGIEIREIFKVLCLYFHSVRSLFFLATNQLEDIFTTPTSSSGYFVYCDLPFFRLKKMQMTLATRLRQTNNSLHLVSEIPMKATETKEMPLVWGSKAFRKQNLSIRLHKISKPQYCCTKNTPDGLSQPVSICYVRYGIIIIL